MKILRTLLIAILLSVAITACGDSGVDEFADQGGAGSGSGTGSESAAGAEPTPTRPPSPTPFRLSTPTPLPPPPTPTPEPAAAEAAESETEAEEAAATVADNMIEIPAGAFTMGSDSGDPEDGPAHEVELPAFEIDKFEVVNSDYSIFAAETGYLTYAEQEGFGSWRNEWGIGEDSHPVIMVTWDDAGAYCEWLGKRLPTEGEWEKAARGDDGRTFSWGNDWNIDNANLKERGLRGTAASGSFGGGASPYGVEDMTGNVWEWTADWYQAYPGNSGDDPYYGEQFRVIRGGGWFDVEAQATTFNRNAADPVKTATDEIGFRCAR